MLPVLWRIKGVADMFIPPKSDVCMKELFRNETVLRYFISAVLALPPEKIHSIRLKKYFFMETPSEAETGNSGCSGGNERLYKS